MTFQVRLALAAALALAVSGCGPTEEPPCGSGQTLCDGSCLTTENGECPGHCLAPLTECNGACLDLRRNPEHCGACGNTCTEGNVCEAGRCVPACPAGQEQCDGACVNILSNPRYCGGCGNVCPGGTVCRAGSCEAPCPADQVECGGTCVDLQNDSQHCGGCGLACKPGSTCSNGACGGCRLGLTACAQACIDTYHDAQNCGGCGTVCATGQACVQGTCRAIESQCAGNLISPTTDAWGTSWDGLERLAATYTSAKQGCESLGARLPTASELFRVNAKRADSIGMTSTNALWSLAPHSPTYQHTVRLSDGATSAAANNATTRLPYRCTCAPPATAFTGNACFGLPGQGCFPIAEGNGRYNLDSMDRPALSKNGAIWECTFNRAHLASYATYVGGIVSGLPNGSGAWLHTADDARYNMDTLLRWTAIQRNWAAHGMTAASTMSTSRPFRCAGTNFTAGTHPNTVSGEFVGMLSGYKGETQNPVQAFWGPAHDTCWSRGGHLPYSAELAELIQQGLPNGAGHWLWTADQAGAITSASTQADPFVAVLARWSGTNPAFGYSYPDFVSHSYKSAVQRAFRCIYYPLDLQYSGPAVQSCQGGCTRFQLPGNIPAVIWVDNQDRLTATLSSAMAGCAALGGRLASVRDYTEAIRRGLPNGSGVFVLSSDLAFDNRSTDTTKHLSYVMVVRWSSSNPAFLDQYPAYSSWSSLETARPYRCVWTNELR